MWPLLGAPAASASAGLVQRLARSEPGAEAHSQGGQQRAGPPLLQEASCLALLWAPPKTSVSQFVNGRGKPSGVESALQREGSKLSARPGEPASPPPPSAFPAVGGGGAPSPLLPPSTRSLRTLPSPLSGRGARSGQEATAKGEGSSFLLPPAAHPTWGPGSAAQRLSASPTPSPAHQDPLVQREPGASPCPRCPQ